MVGLTNGQWWALQAMEVSMLTGETLIGSAQPPCCAPSASVRLLARFLCPTTQKLCVPSKRLRPLLVRPETRRATPAILAALQLSSLKQGKMQSVSAKGARAMVSQHLSIHQRSRAGSVTFPRTRRHVFPNPMLMDARELARHGQGEP